jgi:uncharacterized protein YciI
MAFFVLHALDGASGPEIRKTTRPAHLAWLESLGQRYKFGSPVLTEDGSASVGSLVVIEAKDLAEAKATYAQDPFMKAKLWDRIEIHQLGQWNPK